MTTDGELADRLFATYGLVEGPETEDELDFNDMVDRNVHYTLRVMRQLRSLPVQVRAMVIEHVNAFVDTKEEETE